MNDLEIKIETLNGNRASKLVAHAQLSAKSEITLTTNEDATMQLSIREFKTNENENTTDTKPSDKLRWIDIIIATIGRSALAILFYTIRVSNH